MEVISVYNEYHEDVTGRIIDGRTKFFDADSLDKAILHAKNTRSYYYELFTRKKKGDLKFYGWGVPK